LNQTELEKRRLKMKIQKTLAGALAIIMVCAGAAWAGYHGMGDHNMGDRGMGRHKSDRNMAAPHLGILHSLELTKAQTDQVVEIFNTYDEAHETLRQEMREAREQLCQAIHSDEMVEADIREAARQVGEKLGALSVHKARVFSEIRSILTAEQLEQLEAMKTKCCERRKCRQRLHKAIGDYQDIGE